MIRVANTGTEFDAAIHAGSIRDVEQLLIRGADPSARDREGNPLLRVAAAAGHAQVAAVLLAHGANFEAADTEGRAALCPEVIGLETLHHIRQRYHRYTPAQEWRPAGCAGLLAEFAEPLQRDGIIRLTGLLDDASLKEMQADFGRFVARLNQRILRGQGLFRHYDEEEHFWSRDRAYVSNNAFHHSASLARFCSRADLLGLIEVYLGRLPHLTRAVAMRYLPDEEKSHDMYGWHHDMEDRRLKVLVLLTDVGTDDQYMSYVLGSNRLYHPYRMFLENPCPLAYCEQQLGQVNILNTIGRAGDVFLFDSNGSHRGNRRPEGAVRDAWFVEYSTDLSDVWGGDLPGSVLAGLDAAGRRAFEAFLVTAKKWEKGTNRKFPTWAENLPEIARWVRR